MNQFLSKFNKQFYFQLSLYLFVNALFILKYIPRAGANGIAILFSYLLVVIAGVILFKKNAIKLPEKTFKIAYLILIALMVIIIAISLIYIDRYTVRVDRWSAVTFFLDGLFNGQYPYGIHTHVSETNFPSPFPVWHFLNIPFYLLGDVGIGLIFFLILVTISIQVNFRSYRKSFFFLLLLFISPAYWWEVAVRSDSLSNAFLIFVFILWWIKKRKTLEHNFLFAIIVCGLLASTRLSAIIPIALFLFKPYWNLSWKRKIIFPIGILIVIAITFSPFVFWDTTDWVFFSRNPFMSQTSVGNTYVLGGLILLGIVFGLIWNNYNQFFFATSTFLFIFMLISQLSLVLTRGVDGSVFTDSLYDVSYFSLILPYSIFFLSEKTQMYN
ncbi:MAG: hypothetical protein PHS59_00500 [Paludibacter sp.]|nr:hypothetical protein [Paludibacter sp.]